jgi:glycosyltransferase involved in cell wall biosynthesis
LTTDAAKLARSSRSLPPLPAGAVPDVSVVVAMHNAGATLPALLGSLAGQDCDERYEVVLSDDGSADATVSIASEFAADFPLLVCAAPRRRGAAAARNAGVARASAPIIAFCDADDLVHERWIRSLCAAARRHPLVAGAVHGLDPDAVRPPSSPTTQPFDPAEVNAYYGHLPWTMTANLAIRRDLFTEIGGLAAEMRSGHDADLCWRLASRGVGLAYEPGAIVFKRGRCGVIPTFLQWLRYGRGHPLLFRRHRDAGMPRRSPRHVVRRYAGTAAGIARALRRPRSKDPLTAAARLGQDLGRLIGSARWRCLYL